MASNKFASNFKPTFRASDLSIYLKSPNEKTELSLVFKYWPFKKYLPKQTDKNKRPNIIEKDKEMIKKEWNNQLINGTVNFNDQSVINIVNQTITTSFLNDLDDESNETKIIRNLDFSSLAGPSNKADFKIDYNIDEKREKKVKHDLEIYKSVVKTTIHMERGNQLESCIINKLNNDFKYNFIQDKELKILDLDLFKICGILDGIDHDQKIIVEIKTRNKLVNTFVNFKEKIQCLCYMKLTNCKTSLLVENGPNGEQNIFKIEWDQEEFNKVVDELSELVHKYRDMTKNEFIEIAQKYKYHHF